MQLKPSILVFFIITVRTAATSDAWIPAVSAPSQKMKCVTNPPSVSTPPPPATPQPFSCERRLLINHANHKVPLGNMWACRANCCTFSGINARSVGGARKVPPQPLPAASAVSSLTFWPLLTLLLAMRSSSDIPTLGPCPGKNLLRAWEYEVAWMKRARPTRLL